MVEIEIDGKKVEVPAGSMVMDAANKLGTYIPHFCYHKNYPSRPIAACVWSKSRKHLSLAGLCDTGVGRHDRALK